MSEHMWNRAMQQRAAGQWEQALATVRTHLKFKPRDPHALHLMAMLQLETGQPQPAMVSAQRVLESMPDHVEARFILARSLAELGRHTDAVAHWEAIVARMPSHAASLACLSASYTRLQRAADGVVAAERSLAIEHSTPAAANLAEALLAIGRHEEAERVLEDAVRRDPLEHRLASTWLFNMNYRVRPIEEVLRHHREFGSRLARPSPPAIEQPDPARAIRVGILSPDLGESSVASFIGAFLQHRPPDVRLVAISTGRPKAGDAVTARLRATFDEWVDASVMHAAALDQAIRRNRIDVLVELAGHVWNNALPVVATKPAPVVLTAIGYANTTGVPAVDWRVVDAITDPPGSEHHCSERLLRLDPCFLCYTPPADAPEPVMPGDEIPFTFGSFNNSQKISPQTVDLWARAMAAVPGSRLLVKSQGMADPSARRHLTERLAAAGVEESRVELLSQTPDRAAHLALYGRVHVAVDTVPYNGTTTTCEALWMGVPVLTTLGDRHAARVSASLLTAAGHPEWIARDADDFARRGAAMAADRAGLKALRASMRTHVAASTLCDAAAYGRRFHQAIRACWIQACGKEGRG